jgi:hypothetical protein
LCQKAVKKSGGILEFVPEHLKNTEPEGFALCLAAVKKEGLALRHVPEQHKTGELYLEALRIHRAGRFAEKRSR